MLRKTCENLEFGEKFMEELRKFYGNIEKILPKNKKKLQKIEKFIE